MGSDWENGRAKQPAGYFKSNIKYFNLKKVN